MSNSEAEPSTLTSLRRYFWQPPRAHGDVIEDRSVSFLELFYDLVYVVVVARAAHHLAGHVTWDGVVGFAVVFGLIWIAWMNGTLYHDLHGRADGRTRTFVFVQMGLLALLGVFTSGATGDDGAAFAIVYAIYLAVLTWLWYAVQRQDDVRFRPLTRPYIAGMGLSVALMTLSVFVARDLRIAVWAVVVVGWLIGASALQLKRRPVAGLGLEVSDSLIERFGLFTIIVLGEVVVGVVEGMSDISRSPITIVTGMIGLGIGFAYWWTYFDFVGERRVTASNAARSSWMLGHFPVALGIAATGAAMVSLVEHARDARTPAPTAWLLTASVAVSLLALVLIIRSLADASRLPKVFVPLQRALPLAAVATLALGWLRPAPWVLALALWAVLSSVWFYSIIRWVKYTDPDERVPTLE